MRFLKAACFVPSFAGCIFFGSAVLAAITQRPALSDLHVAGLAVLLVALWLAAASHFVLACETIWSRD